MTYGEVPKSERLMLDVNTCALEVEDNVCRRLCQELRCCERAGRRRGLVTGAINMLEPPPLV